MNTIETIQSVRDIDPDYPACTVLLKGRILCGRRFIVVVVLLQELTVLKADNL